MSDASKIDPAAYDAWLTDQDRWYGHDDLITDDDIQNWNEHSAMIDQHVTDTPVIDPDCRDGKHQSCIGGPCECACHDIEAGFHGLSTVDHASMLCMSRHSYTGSVHSAQYLCGLFLRQACKGVRCNA